MPDAPLTRFQEAYNLHLPAMRAIPADKVIRPRLDIAAATLTILGFLEPLKAHMPALVALPHTAKALVEELPTRTMAMYQAYGQLVGATTPPVALATLVDRGNVVKQSLLDGTVSLVAFRLLDPGPVADIRAGTGHKDLATDLLALVHLYRTAWTKVQGQTPVTPALLAEADQLSDQILTALGERAKEGLTASEATQLRDRAYTLFMESYTEVRRSLEYLRGREGDVDKILPSVFAYKPTGKAGEEEPAPGPAPVPGPLSPQSETGTGGAGTETGGPFSATK